MGLFLKVVRKDPFIFCADYFEGDLAIGTEDKIPRPLGSFKRDIGITDRTFQFRGHRWPPSGRIKVLLFEIQEKIKSPQSPSDSVAFMTEGRHGRNPALARDSTSQPRWSLIGYDTVSPGGIGADEGLEYFSCIPV